MNRGGVVRGTTLAVLATLLTAAGHVAGGGTVPDLALLVVLVPLLAALCGALARRGTLSTLVTLGAGQLALHTLLTLLHPVHDTAFGAPMLLAHAAVTVVLTLVLRHADDAVCAALAALAAVLPRRLSPLPAVGRLPTLAVPFDDVPNRLARTLAATSARRGPPVGH